MSHRAQDGCRLSCVTAICVACTDICLCLFTRSTELCRIEHKMDADVAAARDAHEKTVSVCVCVCIISLNALHVILVGRVELFAAHLCLFVPHPNFLSYSHRQTRSMRLSRTFSKPSGTPISLPVSPGSNCCSKWCVLPSLLFGYSVLCLSHSLYVFGYHLTQQRSCPFCCPTHFLSHTHKLYNC